MSNIQLGFAMNGEVVFKNSDMVFTESVARVCDLDEMFSFTVKLNKNKPSSFLKTYCKEISGTLRNPKMDISIDFIETEEGLTFPKSKHGEDSISIYECENGEFFLTYKEDFSGKYLRRYDLKINFNIFSVLKKTGNFYKIGTKEVFSVDEIENFFGKSIPNKVAA